MAATAAKIVRRDALAALLEQRRGGGARIVCTNGIFDLMHIGHLRYLQAARDLGDLLVVGVNSDASTRRLKGAPRPFVPQDERSEMLAGLACVDIVTIFAEDTAEELVRVVRPAVYVKGGDYTLAPPADATTPAKPLPEAAIVTAQGGSVTLIPYVPDHSTSNLIERIVAVCGASPPHPLSIADGEGENQPA